MEASRCSDRKKYKSNTSKDFRRGRRSDPKDIKSGGQGAVHNPSPIKYLKVGLGFKLRLAMDMAEEMTDTAMPLTNYSRHFCLSYHLKGV